MARPTRSAGAAAAQRGPALRLRRPTAPLRRDRGWAVEEAGSAASSRWQALAQAREQDPQAGHVHAAHGAALGAPPPPGLLTPRGASPRGRTLRPTQHAHWTCLLY